MRAFAAERGVIPLHDILITTRVIFLSHAAVDAALAEHLEDTIRRLDPNVDVFRTSRVGQIPAGRPWFEHITIQLESAECYAILLTPASQSRPWVCFETGVAFQTKRKLVPLLGGGLKHDDLIEPLRNFQAISLENEAGATLAFSEMGLILDDPKVFVASVKRLGELSQIVAMDSEGWQQVVVDGHRYAWDGPIDDLKESFGVEKPAGIEAVLFQAGMKAQYGISGDLWNEQSKGFRQVWRIDTQHRRRHPVVGDYGQVLLALPLSKVRN